MFSAPTGEGTGRPRAGRRRTAQPPPDEEEAPPTDGAPVEAPAPAKQGGWGSDAPAAQPEKSRFGRRASNQNFAAAAEPPTSEPPKPKKGHFDEDGGVDDIMEIPDLEEPEDGGDIAGNAISAPPKVRTGMQTMAELDDSLRDLPDYTELGIDLSILTNQLLPKDQVYEMDVPWDFDVVLADIISEIQTFEDEKNEDKEPEEVNPNEVPVL
eukprot:GFYU01001637.1.p1 GENE.GFYU01001637.1~~GFYU01001637.1.p1  ORF type:complete len:211 (+),score=47.45 GFYU01001637.1:201-833(+)